MDDIEFLKELRQVCAHSFIDGLGAEGASHDQKERLVIRELCKFKRFIAVTGQKRGADRSTGEDGFFGGQIIHRLREITADLFRKRYAQLVCEARGHIRFMADNRNLQ